MKLHLSVEKENFGVPIGEIITKRALYPYFHGGNRNKTYAYSAEYQDVAGTKNLRLKVGDIVYLDGYRFKKGIKKEFGVVVKRYRIKKYKKYGTYSDYYGIVLMTTGKFKGELYNLSPYSLSAARKNI